MQQHQFITTPEENGTERAVMREILYQQPAEEWVWVRPCCPVCENILWNEQKCDRCRWRSAEYVEPPKRWTSNVYDRMERWAVSGGRCFYCGEYVPDRGCRALDHMIPQSRGGTHDRENLIPACRSCNSGKRNKTLEEYREFVRRKYYCLSEQQLAWLHDLGHFVTNDDVPEVLFAFEREDWE